MSGGEIRDKIIEYLKHVPEAKIKEKLIDIYIRPEISYIIKAESDENYYTLNNLKEFIE